MQYTVRFVCYDITGNRYSSYLEVSLYSYPPKLLKFHQTFGVQSNKNRYTYLAIVSPMMNLTETGSVRISNCFPLSLSRSATVMLKVYRQYFVINDD